MTRRNVAVGVTLACSLLLVLTGCAGTVAGQGDLNRLRIMVPASPGGGWDTTSRILQRTLQREGISRNVQVFNVEGAGGAIGLGQLARESDDNLLMTMGLVMVGAVETNKSKTRLDDVTPIARLTGESEILVVPKKSPFQTFDDFLAEWKKDPRKLPIAGGSAGGSDQIVAGLIAQAAGVDPKRINYIPYAGGGESLGALLGGKVAAGISGVGEYAEQVRSGDLRALAVSGAERTDQLPETKTLKEQGVDVTFTNWRGVMARPGMSADARAALTELVQKAHDSKQWKEALVNNGWEDQFLAGEEFGAFVKSEEQRVNEVLREIGLIT